MRIYPPDNEAAAIEPVPDIRTIELDAVESAELAVFQAEEALLEAKRVLKITEGRRWIVKDSPTWKQIFVPQMLMTPDQLYTQCMQTGYRYVLWNGRIYRAGRPGEQLIDTGVFEEDIK